MTRRSERLGEQLRAEIVRLIREEVTDPRVGLVTLTRVDLAPDLSHALVFWSPLSTKEEPLVKEMQAGLESAAGFLRRQVASSLQLRRTPALDFRFDAAFEKGGEILELLGEVKEGERTDHE